MFLPLSILTNLYFTILYNCYFSFFIFTILFFLFFTFYLPFCFSLYHHRQVLTQILHLSNKKNRTIQRKRNYWKNNTYNIWQHCFYCRVARICKIMPILFTNKVAVWEKYMYLHFWIAKSGNYFTVNLSIFGNIRTIKLSK